MGAGARLLFTLLATIISTGNAIRWGLGAVHPGRLFGDNLVTDCDTSLIVLGGEKLGHGVPSGPFDESGWHRHPLRFDLRSRTWRQLQPLSPPDEGIPVMKQPLLHCFGDVLVVLGHMTVLPEGHPSRPRGIDPWMFVPRSFIYSLHLSELRWRKSGALVVQRRSNHTKEYLHQDYFLESVFQTTSFGSSRLSEDHVIFDIGAGLQADVSSLVRSVRTLAATQMRIPQLTSRVAAETFACTVAQYGPRPINLGAQAQMLSQAVDWRSVVQYPEDLKGNHASACLSLYQSNAFEGQVTMSKYRLGQSENCTSRLWRLIYSPRLPPVVWDHASPDADSA